MTYDEAIAWLYALEPRGIRLELERMRAACAMAGDPQRASRYVHVAGTNGKGSVAAMCDAALRAAGLRVGMFTSPHLHRFGERVCVDGVAMGDAELVRRVAEVRALLETPGAPELTFFEASTLLAFSAFRDAKCDVVVLEVGLGGRLDSTNVAEDGDVVVSVITGIALDHMAMLGSTIAEIAAEKAGVVRRGVPVVTGASGEALEVIARRAAEVGAELVNASDVTLDALRPALVGAHQERNAAIAATALVVARRRGLAVDDDAIRRGIAGTVWPARLESVRAADGDVLFDAAHNAEGAAALAAYLDVLPRGRRVLVFGASLDKDHAAMLAALMPRVDSIVYTRAAVGRATPPAVFAGIARGEVREEPLDAYARARELAGPSGLVVVAGSIFVLAPIRARVLGLVQERTIAM